MPAKKTLEYCQNLASKRGGRCLSTEYKNSKTKMEWECQESHKWKAKSGDIQQGYWCPECAGLVPKTLEFCQNLAKLKNGKCVSSEYENVMTRVEWECQEGHRWGARAHDIQRGSWCPYCAGKAPKTLEDCQNLAKLKNGECSSIEYKNALTKMEWECQEGHRWEARANNIQQGQWCPYCHPQYSKEEKELFEFIKEKYPEAEPNRRGLLKNKRLELDIYIPSLKAGIEYDGEYWHTTEEVIKRDLIKNEQCREAGITLIRVSDKDYTSNPISVKQNLLKQLSFET